MSRYYQIQVTVRGYRPERLVQICDALRTLWDFDPAGFPLGEHPEVLDVTGVDDLRAGEADDEFATRLAQAVWAANGTYCAIELQSTYLDAPPPTIRYNWSEFEYQELLAAVCP